MSLNEFEQGLASGINLEHASFSPENADTIKGISSGALYRWNNVLGTPLFKKMEELQTKIEGNITESRENGVIVWTYNERSKIDKKDIVLSQTVIQKMAGFQLYQQDDIDRIVMVNPQNNIEVRYSRLNHGDCICIKREIREIGKPWPSEIENTPKCEGAQN